MPKSSAPAGLRGATASRSLRRRASPPRYRTAPPPHSARAARFDRARSRMGCGMNEEAEALFTVLRQSIGAEVAAAIEDLLENAPDPALCRVNALKFAAANALDEEAV